MKRLLLFVLIIMGFCGRFASDAKRCPVAQAVVEPVEPLLVRPVQDDMQCRLWVDSVLDRLSLKERVGQLFIYTIAPHQDKSNRELLRKVIEDYKVGGLLFSGGLMQNQVMLTNEAQRMADIPLLITFDGEWGLSMRLRDTPAFPKNMVLGCIQNDSLLYEYGREMARQCKELTGEIKMIRDEQSKIWFQTLSTGKQILLLETDTEIDETTIKTINPETLEAGNTLDVVKQYILHPVYNKQSNSICWKKHYESGNCIMQYSLEDRTINETIASLPYIETLFSIKY